MRYFYYVATTFSQVLKKAFLIILEIHYLIVRSNYLRKYDKLLFVWVTLHLGFVFARHCDVFLLHHNYVIYCFDEVTFFDAARITLYLNYIWK